jgi:hypothetical protein
MVAANVGWRLVPAGRPDRGTAGEHVIRASPHCL